MKLGSGDDDGKRIAAVRRAAPKAELIVDANEGWDESNLAQNLAACAEQGVTLIEQPLPEGRDTALARIKRPIPICADESAHDRGSLDALTGKYDAINIKLDKAGGLTEALALAAEAERRGFGIMVGCMVATSLAMAPTMLVAQLSLIHICLYVLFLYRSGSRGRPESMAADAICAPATRRRFCADS